MSITEYNGSAVVAMSGKNCVAIAADTRYGIQLSTIAFDLQRTFKMEDRLYLGLSGLITDVQTFKQKVDFELKLYKLREGRAISPKAFSHLVSNMLYEKRFGPYFCEPVIAGISPNGETFITAMDLIGADCTATDFVVSGTSSEELYGMCESLYREDMGPEDLFETISQALKAAVNRDCIAGWGGVVTVITPEGSFTRTLEMKQD